ncbi:hypothetical protein AN416_22335 [Paraburkholderia caribensis]|jgi:hypothetical protein|nr:hypothetical protein AN416_22335 [Paraburkholderia caribensis]
MLRSLLLSPFLPIDDLKQIIVRGRQNGWNLECGAENKNRRVNDRSPVKLERSERQQAAIQFAGQVNIDS